MALFPSEIAAVVFYIVYFIWILSEIIGGSLIPRSRRQKTKIKRKDKGSGLFIFISIFISITIAFSFAIYGIAKLPGWVCYLGIILMVLGILIRQWAINVLGNFFSMTVGTQEGQKVVDKGPYRFVRHPSYTGAFLTLAGIGLALQSWGAVLALLAIFGLAFGYRIYVEEKVLISELGEEYIQYSRNTKRLIPYIV